MQRKSYNRQKRIVYICFSVFYILTLGNFCNAQNKFAELNVLIPGTNINNGEFRYSVYKADTLKSITTIPAFREFEKKHLLPCGNYRIEVYKNDSLYVEFNPVTLECGYKLTYTIDLVKKSSYQINENSEQGMFEYVNPISPDYDYFYPYIQLGYGTQTLETNNYSLKHLFKFAAGGFLNYPITKRIAFGINPECNFQYAVPRRDTSFRGNANYLYERITYLNFKYGFYFRISTFNMRQEHKGGFFLDAGANYYFPIFFRHAGIYDNHKDITRFIHKYNDVSLLARIGTDLISAEVNYRLFNFVKGGFEQLPILTFGINFRIAD
jgi:hypothetical protein